jgi:hypothetical protein
MGRGQIFLRFVIMLRFSSSSSLGRIPTVLDMVENEWTDSLVRSMYILHSSYSIVVEVPIAQLHLANVQKCFFIATLVEKSTAITYDTG